MSIGRREAVAVAAGALLVVAAFVVPDLHLGIVTPLVKMTPQQIRDFADAAPIFGWWRPHMGWGTVPAILIGLVRGRLGPVAGPAAVLAPADIRHLGDLVRLGIRAGDDRRLAAGLRRAADREHEYLRQVPGITDIPEAVRTFASRILDFQPNSWITHVSGHPPGALLTFVWLDRIGLGGERGPDCSACWSVPARRRR